MGRGPHQRRERILGVAEQLFTHYGAAKTTIADIAKACGIGVGSVYLDFSSKEAILAELSQKKVRSVAERMARAAKSESAPERLIELLEARVDALFEVAGDGQHACDLVRCPFAFGQAVREVFLSELRRGQDRGELRAFEVDETLRALELAFAALSPPQIYQWKREEAVAMSKKLSVLVVRGLAKG